MPAPYQEDAFMQALEALIQKKVEETWNNKVELESRKATSQKCNKDQLLEKELLTRKETAALLSISLVTLSKWTNQGRLTAYRIGTRVRYKADEVKSALIEIKSTKYQRK